MSHGGKRVGAGRKPMVVEPVTIGWKVSSNAKEWITTRAEELGVTSGVILDLLIDHFIKTTESK